MSRKMLVSVILAGTLAIFSGISFSQKSYAQGTYKPVTLKNGKNVVSFLSEGTEVAGHLFVPATYRKGDKLPVVVVVAPATGVKEQTAGIYAGKLSEKGFITLAFDHRTFGESRGEPRYYENPFMKSEDIKNAVSFAGSLQEVDKNKIGTLGICSGAAYSIYSASTDMRVKAVATVSGVSDHKSEATVEELQKAAAARQKYYETGEMEYTEEIPDSFAATPKDHPLYRFLTEAFDYYRTSRGSVPTHSHKIAYISREQTSSFSELDVIHLLSPRPLLLINGSKADTAFFNDKVYQKAKEPKERFLIEGASHIDLYDKDRYVSQAVEKLSQFYLQVFNK